MVPSLNNNAIKSYPRKLKLGITKTTTSATVNQLVSGVKISEGSASATAPMGTLERVGSEIATSNNALSISRVGAGYSNGTYTNVNLFAITGAGSSATGIVTVLLVLSLQFQLHLVKKDMDIPRVISLDLQLQI